MLSQMPGPRNIKINSKITKKAPAPKKSSCKRVRAKDLPGNEVGRLGVCGHAKNGYGRDGRRRVARHLASTASHLCAALSTLRRCPVPQQCDAVLAKCAAGAGGWRIENTTVRS